MESLRGAVLCSGLVLVLVTVRASVPSAFEYEVPDGGDHHDGTYVICPTPAELEHLHYGWIANKSRFTLYSLMPYAFQRIRPNALVDLTVYFVSLPQVLLGEFSCGCNVGFWDTSKTSM